MSRRPDITFTAAYIHVFAVLLVSGLCLNVYFLWNQWRDLEKGYADFTIFYAAADVIRTGHAADLYNEQVQYFAQKAVAPDVSIRSMALPFNHPPFEALLFIPLSYLPYFAAYLLWAAANVGFILIALWLLRSQALSAVHFSMLFVASLIFFPVFITLFQGQDLLLLLLIVSATYAFLQRDHDFRAGCCLGLGLFRPELALPTVLLIGLLRGKRFAAGFAVSASALIGLSFAIVGWQRLLGYPAYVWRLERVHGHGSIVPYDMPNLRGLVSLFLLNHSLALIVTVVASAATLAFSIWQIRSSGVSGGIERVFCIATLCSLLISFHGLKHDLALLVVPIMFVFTELAAEPKLAARQRAFLCWPALFFFCTPALVFFWLGLQKFCLVAFVLVFWLWSISTAPIKTGHETQLSARQV